MLFISYILHMLNILCILCSSVLRIRAADAIPWATDESRFVESVCDFPKEPRESGMVLTD